MNKSKYITSEDCKKCNALCCKSFSIVYDKKLAKIDPIMFSELIRFKDLDSDGKIEVKEEEKYWEVTFNYPCKHLINNDGVYSCKIYNSTRPLLCQEFPYKETIKADCPFKKIRGLI